MPTRRDILSKAADECMKELYSLVQPAVTWEGFLYQNKEYTKKYREWEKHDNPEWEGKHINDCIGPAPYNFYYLPQNIMKEVVDSYVYAYRIISQDDLLNTIELLKGYFENPIVDKYFPEVVEEDGFKHPGHRGYEHPKDITTQFCDIITDSNINLSGNTGTDVVNLADKCWDKVKEFFNMANRFYNWNSELNSFNMTVYLGSSPNSNKEAVIENWKKYRYEDIEIDESKWDNNEDF